MPRTWRYSPEERAHRAIERMSPGTIKGQIESAAPARGALPTGNAGGGVTIAGTGLGTLVWQSHPDEMPDAFLGLPWYWPFDGMITNIRASCARPPTADADLDVQLNGSTILASSITIGTTAGLTADYGPTTAEFARDDVLQVIGGTMNGALDITVYVDFARSTT